MKKDKSSDISQLNPLTDFHYNKTQSIYMSHEENKHDIGKYSSFNSENLKNSFNTQPERKIVLNTESMLFLCYIIII